MNDNNPAKKIVTYRTQAGKVPFNDWFYGLQDRKTRQRILNRLYRMEQGHYGDYKAVGNGVLELRPFFGAGYRIYFGEDGEEIVILLTGGDKNSQNQDIRQAKSYWQEYLDHAHSSDTR